VVDSNARRLEEVHRHFPSLRTSRDPEEAFSAPDVDAVVIATPTCTHYELSARALEEGKHVLVEKPMAESVQRAEALSELSARMDRVLMVGHVFIYNAAARYVKEAIDRGVLGRVYYLSMVRTNLGPIRVDVNAAWDLAAHDISLASYWLGVEPLAVSARGGSWINPGVEDAVFATLRYPGDVLANLHASWLNPRKARDITVVGDEGMLTFDDVDVEEPVRIFDKQVSAERGSAPFIDSYDTFRTVVSEGRVSVPEIEQSQPLQNECEHFLDCCLDGRTPDTGGNEGVAVVRALEALSRSLAEQGREIPLDG
jgi:predicted dehydrogenase